MVEHYPGMNTNRAGNNNIYVFVSSLYKYNTSSKTF